VLQIVEVADGRRIDQETIGRGTLAVVDRISVGQWQERVREHLVLGDGDAAIERAVGRVVEEVEAALEGTGLVGLFAEDRRRGRGRGGGPAQEPGHGAGLGQAHRRGIVLEGLELLRRDDAVVIRVDDREVFVADEVLDRFCSFDRGDGITD
jgi:hypothetical protein